MKRDDLLIKALKNVLIQLKIYEMKDLGCTEEEILDFIDNHPLTMDIVSNPIDMQNIIEAMEDIGMDVCGKFDVEDLTLFFGVEIEYEMPKIEGITDSRASFEIDVLDQGDFVNHLMFNTVYEMITEGDYPDSFPEELVSKTIEYFASKEEFDICEEIKSFMENNSRLITSSMSKNEFEQWKIKNIWKLYA